MNLKYLFYYLIGFLFIGVSCNSDSDDINSEEFAEPGVQQKSAKRGVSYNFQLPEEDMDLLGSSVSWFYNWGSAINSTLNDRITKEKIDYYPMAWNGNYSESNIRNYKATHPECEYILAFNEPNLKEEANMTPRQAAELWPPLKALADELGMKLISPAMNYGTLENYHDPYKWLDEFFELVPLSDVAGIAVHCYMGTPGAFISYIQGFKKYGKPIWMTEFCGWEDNIGSAEAQMAYMSDVLNYMECDPDVYRYAWFIPRWDKTGTYAYPYMQLLTSSKPYELTELGKVFVNFSTFDKNTYYIPEQVIAAVQYSSLNMSDAASSSKYTESVRTRVSTDKAGSQPVEIYNFFKDYWIEYQMAIPKTDTYTLSLRYASYRGATINITLDGKEIQKVILDKTGEDNIWETAETELDLESGKHTIRFTMSSGSMSFGWWSFN